MKKLFLWIPIVFLLGGCAQEALSPYASHYRTSTLQTMRNSPNLTEKDPSGHHFGAGGIWEYQAAYWFEDNVSGKVYELYIFDNEEVLSIARSNCELAWVQDDLGHFLRCDEGGYSCRREVVDGVAWYWICD